MSNDGTMDRFNRLCIRLGVNDWIERWKELDLAYIHESRSYHKWPHIQFMLTEFDKYKDALEAPDLVEWSIFWHDFFYRTMAPSGANEVVSGGKAAAIIRPSEGLEIAERIVSLIIVTEHRNEPQTMDERYLCDFDLAILGQPQEVYERYAAEIRDEYSWVPLDTYREGRINILRDFLNRGQIFWTKPYRQGHELQAVKNLTQEIKLLGG